MKSENITDLKSVGGNALWVQVPPRVQHSNHRIMAITSGLRPDDVVSITTDCSY